MFRQILVPLDRSDYAESALPPALALAERTGGEVHLVHVDPAGPLNTFAGQDGEADARPAGDQVRSGATYLEEVAERIRESGSGVAVHRKTLTGNVVAALHRWIIESSIDQVVMTTHGRGRVQRLWLGSVADGLIRRAPCPILFWRPLAGEVELGDRRSFRRILVPLDGSELASSILPWIARLAELDGASVSLVSVILPPPSLGSSYLPHAAEEEAHRAAERLVLERYLRGVADDLRDRGLLVETAIVAGSRAAEEILAFSEGDGADLLALSTHGRGGVARMVMGSVADKVLRGSEIHVLVHREHEES